MSIDMSTVTDSLKDFDTPYYYYDLDKVSENLEQLGRYFKPPESKIFFPVKTNDHPLFLRFLKGRGINAEVSSGMELDLARKIGFSSIIFNSPAKTPEELKKAVSGGDTVVVLDSLQDLQLLSGYLSARTQVGIRISSSSRRQDKFGMNMKDASDALHAISGNSLLSFAGFHFHLGSFIYSTAAYRRMFENIISMMKKLPAELFKDMQFVDIGGGLQCGHKIKQSILERSMFYYTFKYSIPHRYLLKKEREYLRKMEDFDKEKIISRLYSETAYQKSIVEELVGSSLKIYLEPGTGIAGDAVDVYSRVLARKDNKVLIDASRFIQHSHDIFWHPVYNVSEPARDIREEYVFGPLNTPHDMYSRCYVGGRLENNSLVRVRGMGAYSFSFHSSFSKPQLSVVVRHGGNIDMVTGPEEFSEKYCRYPLGKQPGG